MEYLIWIIIWIILAALVIFIIYYINRKPKSVSSSRNIPSPKNVFVQRNVPKSNIRRENIIEDEKNAKLGTMKQDYFQNKIKDIQDKLKD